jgi:hypothetical protein
MGTVIAIREPFVSINHQARAGPSSGRADHGILVDSPTDIIILADDELSDVHWSDKTAPVAVPHTNWLGSSFLCKSHKLPTIEQVEIELKRLLLLDRAGEAYREMCRQRKMGRPVAKRVEGLVLFQFDAWEAAREAFSQAKEEEQASKSNGEANDLAAASDFGIAVSQLTSCQAAIRCQCRILQASQGLSTADMRSIYFATANGVTILDTSTFVGPIKVHNISGAGRGLITTRDVKPGELLLCCKALCASYPDDEECQGSPLLRLNLDNGVISTTSQVRAQTKLIHAIVGECMAQVHS